MTDVSLRPYEFTEAIFYKDGGAVVGDSATDTFTADAAHECLVGDMVIFTALGGLSSVSLATRYFVVNVGSPTTLKVSATLGGTPISLGSGTDVTIKRFEPYAFPWPQNATPNITTKDYTWSGGGQEETDTLLTGINLPIALDAIPVSAHQGIFGKTSITGALPGGGTNGKSYGGGNDQGGVSGMLLLKAYSKKSADGVASTPLFARWFPSGKLALTGPAGLQSGQKATTTGYTFTATKTSTDFLGGAITGVSAGGEFYIDYEL